MLFNSFQFLIFFMVVTSLFFALKHKHRWWMLLLASCYFYMAFVPVYILILGFTIVIDYFAGLWIEKADGKKRKVLLVISLISNIGVLAIFKYYNFLNDNLTGLLHLWNATNQLPYLSILLPIGLSFHTFQAMSYTIEVYRGNQKAERHFGIYALYVMFYPQLVAGPIERPQHILHQLHEEKFFDYTRVSNGLKLMLWGLFKKVVIADRLAILVNQVYANPESFDGLQLSTAAVFFSFQIYCDFSGYSDIAIGSAQVMGYKLMDNFNRPYFSKSISEFWKRWHISLSTWFKDYLYISLGGNRVVKWKWYYNLFITFVVSGLWHGANWTFITWGALHGIYLIVGVVTARKRKQLVVFTGIENNKTIAKYLNVACTFFLVTIGWVFFRAESMDKAWYILTHLFQSFNFSNYFTNGFAKLEMLKCFSLIILLELVHYMQRHNQMRTMLAGKPIWLQWTIYYSLILMVLIWGVFDHPSFIYFQF